MRNVPPEMRELRVLVAKISDCYHLAKGHATSYSHGGSSKSRYRLRCECDYANELYFQRFADFHCLLSSCLNQEDFRVSNVALFFMTRVFARPIVQPGDFNFKV